VLLLPETPLFFLTDGVLVGARLGRRIGAGAPAFQPRLVILEEFLAGFELPHHLLVRLRFELGDAVLADAFYRALTFFPVAVAGVAANVFEGVIT
jgi:hypothetical protein